VRNSPEDDVAFLRNNLCGKRPDLLMIGLPSMKMEKADREGGSK
jgi:hypothetical protein